MTFLTCCFKKRVRHQKRRIVVSTKEQTKACRNMLKWYVLLLRYEKEPYKECLYYHDRVYVFDRILQENRKNIEYLRKQNTSLNFCIHCSYTYFGHRLVKEKDVLKQTLEEVLQKPYTFASYNNDDRYLLIHTYDHVLKKLSKQETGVWKKTPSTYH